MKLTTSLTLLAISLLPLSIQAAPADKTAESETMEVITVIYRTPFDYALHQYTTELLSQFRIQIQADIYTQARASSLKMAESQQPITAWNTPYTTKEVADKWVRSE
ncbi:hypothetical protein Ssed_3470 [Shewanella sediminis HAW-EB3]|uniref:Uncharacterized protein n=1 Tax=Shewanella sediminis (strain HAW-EB3) TaxID=425104 RepID=A8FZ01_SHESH|nr:hypothetical protein [Shewanella sediminis]ABV38074.1 hypothetical protein Ssed_3470 [Shewanella sediminis HAW-EB3]